MFRKNYLTFLFITAVLLAGSVSAFAQTGPVGGEVKLKKADGTIVPVADATVEAFRTDIAKGAMPAAKTNKKGEFHFVGFQLGHRFVLSVSGAGIGPRVQPDVKAGMENIVINVEEGDGRKLTEVEAREAAKSSASAPTGEMSAADKAKQAELIKKNAEIDAKNKKLQAEDEVARAAAKDGFAALEAKNYDLAISKFDEGITAVPDYVGSTPVLLAGKVQALKSRGFNYYVQGAGSKEVPERLAKYELAKKEYASALAAYDQGIAIVKKAPAATDPKDQAGRRAVMDNLYSGAIEVQRLMAVGQVDTTKTAAAETMINEYVAFETDPLKQAKAKVTLGDIMRAAGEFDKAIALYKGVLETQPDNTEVMASLGLSLVALGTMVDPPNKAQLQEGLNYMQKYADTVQILPTDPKTVQEFKQSVKDTVEYLKTEQNLKAQPTKAGPAKRKT
jgi:tetratricopeptide (TPR) repeat protein